MKFAIMYLFFSLFFLTSSDQCNSIDYINFTLTGDKPFIHIVDEQVDCQYKAETLIFSTREKIIENFHIRRNINSFEFRIDSGEYSVLFDLSVNIDESYVVKIGTEDKRVKLKNVHSIGSKFIYEFILSDVFYYEEAYFDMTFLVSAERFVEGCYLLAYDPEGKEVVISEQGNLFRNYIDYSMKTFGRLE